MTRPDRGSRARWVALLGTGLVGAGCALAGAAFAGTSGAAAAAVGTVVVVAFFAGARMPVAMAEQVRLRTGAGVALVVVTFVVRWLLVLVVLGVAATSEAVHDRTLGATVIACGLAWSLLQLAVFVARARGT